MKRQLRHERWDAAERRLLAAGEERAAPTDGRRRPRGAPRPVRGAGGCRLDRADLDVSSRDHAAQRGDHPALVAPTADPHLRRARRPRANRLARVLRDHGAGRRRAGRASMLANSCEWFETNVAVARLGAQLVPVNWHLRARRAARGSSPTPTRASS